MPGTMPKMSCPLINSRRRLVAISSGKVLPMNMEIMPTSRGTGMEQRSCKVRLGELAAADGTETVASATTPGSAGSGGEGGRVEGAAASGSGVAMDGWGTTPGCAVAGWPAATFAGQASCKVRRRWRAVFFQ